MQDLFNQGLLFSFLLFVAPRSNMDDSQSYNVFLHETLSLSLSFSLSLCLFFLFFSPKRLKEIIKMSSGGEHYIAPPLPPGKGIQFIFPYDDDAVQVSDPMILLQRVSFGYREREKKSNGEENGAENGADNDGEQKTNRKSPTLLFDSLTLKINRGDRIALVGPNGSGKSTLLNIIIEELHGGLRPLSGSVIKKGGTLYLVFYFFLSVCADLLRK